jgi:pyruvate dehydrogenase (quinone)
VLNAGTRVAILAGQGALGATEQLEQLAETLAAPIVKALLGKAVVPDDSPYTTGGIGLLGTRPSQEALETCDTLFLIGTSFPYIEYYPKPAQARGVQLDIDPVRIGLRIPSRWASSATPAEAWSGSCRSCGGRRSDLCLPPDTSSKAAPSS